MDPNDFSFSLDEAELNTPSDWNTTKTLYEEDRNLDFNGSACLFVETKETHRIHYRMLSVEESAKPVPKTSNCPNFKVGKPSNTVRVETPNRVTEDSNAIQFKIPKPPSASRKRKYPNPSARVTEQKK